MALQNHLDRLEGRASSTVKKEPRTDSVKIEQEAAQAITSTRPLEIREYCDENGNLLDAQVVDVSSELVSAGQALKADKTGGPPSMDSDGTGNVFRDKEGNEISREDIFKKLKDVLNIPDEGGGDDNALPEETNVRLPCGIFLSP